MGVWIDTDMGFDDLAAILVVQGQGLTIDGLSLVFGCATLSQVKRNASGAAKAFGWTCPIHTGRGKPVLAPLETAANILGDTGIPTLGLTLPDGAALRETSAFDALCHWLEDGTAEKRVLALGPLTNIAALALARPDLAARIDRLVWMGGGLSRGNHTASAEFNAYADPEALAIVLAHGLPLTMVDLDVCRTITASPEDVVPIRDAGGKNAALLADLTAGFIDIAIQRGRPAMTLFDPAAAVVFARPDLVTLTQAHIAVELAGSLTRGRTVVETRASHASFNASFASACQIEAVRDVILNTLVKEAGKP